MRALFAALLLVPVTGRTEGIALDKAVHVLAGGGVFTFSFSILNAGKRAEREEAIELYANREGYYEAMKINPGPCLAEVKATYSKPDFFLPILITQVAIFGKEAVDALRGGKFDLGDIAAGEVGFGGALLTFGVCF